MATCFQLRILWSKNWWLVWRLYKTESLRLHSNNDISSQFQVYIMPNRKRDRAAKKKQSLPTCIMWLNWGTGVNYCGRNSSERSCMSSAAGNLIRIWSWSFYSSESSRWHIKADMRDTRHTFPTVDWCLISYANPLQPDPDNSPRWSGKYRVSSPALFALYWQSNSSRRWYKTAITNTTTASLHPWIVFSSFESDYLRSGGHVLWEDREDMWRPLNQESWRLCMLEKQGQRMAAKLTTGWENGTLRYTMLLPWNLSALNFPTSTGIA